MINVLGSSIYSIKFAGEVALQKNTAHEFFEEYNTI